MIAKLSKRILMIALVAVTLYGCTTTQTPTGEKKVMTKTGKGAAIGTAGGAAAGAIVGKVAGNTALGAIIGAAVGGATGAVIGKKMDQQAKEIEASVPDAEVERSGEGIVISFDSNVLFGFDQSDLTTQAKNTIDKLVAILNQYPEEDVLIIGHTDNVGKEDYNQKLSERRAGSTADYLLARGIASNRVSTKGMGMSDPKVDNDTEEHRAQNRRVEFVLTANDQMKLDAEQEASQQ